MVKWIRQTTGVPRQLNKFLNRRQAALRGRGNRLDETYPVIILTFLN